MLSQKGATHFKEAVPCPFYETILALMNRRGCYDILLIGQEPFMGVSSDNYIVKVFVYPLG